MKTLLLILLTPIICIGQITITSTDIESGGGEFYYSTPENIEIDLSITGANQNWDLSNLTAASQRTEKFTDISDAGFLIQLQFGGFSPSQYQATNSKEITPMGLEQAGGTIPIDAVNAYLKVSSSAVTLPGISLGSNGQELPYRSDTIETVYELPLSFGNSYASRGYTFADFNPIYDAQFKQYRQRSSQVDAWGNLTTPYGTFEVLRVHHTINETDSIYISQGGVGTWLELPIPLSHEYEWVTKNEGIPVLIVVTTEVLGVETVSRMEYKDNAIEGLNVKENNTVALQVSPNPSNGIFNITSNNTLEEVIVYNQLGKKILTLTGNTIDLSAYPKGNYIALLKTKKGSKVQKLILR